MKILYITDLHGNRWKYDAIIKIADCLDATMIINGGDLYPKDKNLLKNGDLFNQDCFVEKFLDKHLKRASEAGLVYLLCPGNDDLLRFDSLLNEVVTRYPGVHNVDRRLVTVEEYDFIGLSLVSDYRFQLKDRVRRDTKDHVFERQNGCGLLSTGKERSWIEIEDWYEHAISFPALEEELDALPIPQNLRRAVYIIHDPPDGVRLDAVTPSRFVGSKAVRKFLVRTQPLLSLHGHIHESPRSTGGRWKAEIGDTLAIQPGQERFLPYVVIEIEGERVRAEMYSIEKGEAKRLRKGV